MSVSPASGRPIALRPMLPADIPVLAAIFGAAVDELAAEDYDAGQRAAWAGEADDETRFGRELSQALTLVATLDGAPIGFLSLVNNDRIEKLYVYPRAARQGAASLLLDAAMKLAGARGTKAIEADASDTARPFFEARGFEALHRQTLQIGDVWLGNTRMRRKLD